MKQKNIALYTDISGNKINFRTYTYGSGPHGIYIQGGVHGGEITYYIFHALHAFLKKHEKQLKKRVLLAPIINPPAWNQRMYYYTAGKFDFYKGADWNRKYPGDETNLSGRNAKIIFDLASTYEFAIDLHTARHSMPYVIFADKKLQPYIKTLGLPYNIFSEKGTKYKGAFHDAFAMHGKNAVTIETGSHDDYHSQNIQMTVDAIIRLFEKLDIINEKQITSTEKQYVVTAIKTLYSPVSGFAKYLVEPQELINKNQTLAEIYPSDSLGKVVKMKAPFDGLLFELPKTHIVWTGDEIFKIVPKESCIPLA